MNTLITLVQALGIAYAAGLDLYATVAVIGLVARYGWVADLPGSLGGFDSPWVIGIAIALTLIEFIATILPGVSSAWDTVHSLIRPPAAAALAAATVWHGDPILVLVAALLGGGVAVTTHTTKLGLCYAIDSTPSALMNFVANLLELAVVVGLVLALWKRPFVALGVAIALWIVVVMSVRLIWRVLRQVFSGHWMPGRGLLQHPRPSESIPSKDE